MAIVPATAAARATAFVGGTLVDVGAKGRRGADIRNAVIVVKDGRVVAVGRAGRLRPPRDAEIVDATGRYIVPGLIDGLGAMRTQGFADAYLHEGVTTVVVAMTSPDRRVDGEARLETPVAGPSILTAVPIGGYDASGNTPAAGHWIDHRLNDRRLTRSALRAAIARAAAAGHRGIVIGADMWPDQLSDVVSVAHARGLFVIGRPVFTPYRDAIASGIDVLIRNDSYTLSLASAPKWARYVDDPIGGGGRDAMRAICGEEDIAAAATAMGGDLARSRTAVMPVLVMEATADDIGGPNPWTLPGAAFVTPADLDDPVDAVTGARPYLESHPDRREAIRACARAKQGIDRRLHAAGATYLAGTATPSYGVMPGSGVHVELQLLVGIGLTPREALAAATGNYADHAGFSDRGLLTRGRRADLVILCDDPTRSIDALDRIDRVMLAGRFVARSAGGGRPALCGSPARSADARGGSAR